MTIASFSGGQDSSCMVIACLERGIKIDSIIFCDTGFEFPEMSEYVDKFDLYLQRNFNQSITRLKAQVEELSAIEYWAFVKPISRGKDKGRLRGLPKVVGLDYCTRESKVIPIKKYVLERSKNALRNKVLIGYTYNEVQNGRTTYLDYARSEYPLHTFKMNETEVDSFLKQRGIHNKLYNYFKRTGCYFCPKQNLNSLYHLYLHYPKEWNHMKEWESKARALNCVNQTWKINTTLQALENKFKKQGEPLLKENQLQELDTCFCLR